MAEKFKAVKKVARKPGPRFAVKLMDDSGVGLKVATSYDYRNKLFRVSPSIWPKGFGKGKEYPRERVEPTTIGPDFADAEAAAKAVVAEQEAAGWVRVASKGSATYASIPAPGTVQAE